jgi:hypothetical protein
MRMVKGLILLMIGAVWGYPGIALIWIKLRSMQTDADFAVGNPIIFGQSVSFPAACVITLLPAAIIIGSGIYLLRTLPRDEF